MSDWTQINTCLPLENEDVLAWGNPWSKPKMAYFGKARGYCTEFENHTDHESAWRYSDDDRMIESPGIPGFKITHWQPLPNPPQQ